MVFCRQLFIIGYADKYTENVRKTVVTNFLAVVKPENFQTILPQVVDFCCTSDSMVNLQMLNLKGWKGISGVTCFIEFNGNLDVSLMGQYSFLFQGEAAKSEISTLKGFALQTTPPNSCLLLIKPHAISASGKIIKTVVENGFSIRNMKYVHVGRSNAEEFLEIYKTILPEYSDMVCELISGYLLALCLTYKDEKVSAVSTLRELCGPYDPEIAKTIRPNSIRAKFGKNKVCNAVHCTDLEEYNALEVDYFFKILK
jgi:nucleoside diphosphate kinase